MSNLQTYYHKPDFQKVDQHTGGKWLIHDIAYITAVTEAEYKSQFEPTDYIPYLTGELWDASCEDLEENR